MKKIIYYFLTILVFAVSSQGAEVFDFYKAHGVKYYCDLARENHVVGRYYPGSDHIHLLKRSKYRSSEEMNQTALHEMAHWAHHHSRLGRFHGGQYHEDDEDIMCEIAAAVLADQLKLPRESDREVRYHVLDYMGPRHLSQRQWTVIFRETQDTVSYLLDKPYPRKALQDYFVALQLVKPSLAKRLS